MDINTLTVPITIGILILLIVILVFGLDYIIKLIKRNK